MLNAVLPGSPRNLAAVRLRPKVIFAVAVAVGALTTIACRDAMSPSAATDDATAAGQQAFAEDGNATEPGIGGLFFMPAGGDAVTPVDLQGTGIRIPVGTQVTVEVTGTITRSHTPGLVQFCQLPHMKPKCEGNWVEILRTTPFTPSGGKGPQAMVAWEGGEPASPDSATGSALIGPAGGELWAGRRGLQCWYVDNYSGIQGACFAFGGGYTVTVSSRPTAAIGGGGAGGVEATLALSILRSTVGPTGGSADLALKITTTPDTAPKPQLGFTRWFFLPDSIRKETGTPVPSPFEARASFSVGGQSPLPVRLDADRVRLPDGRVVGSGVHVVTRTATPQAAPSGRRANASRTSTAAVGTTTSYPDCDGASACSVRFDAPSGTFVASTTLGGYPVSASVRVGAVQGGNTAKVQVVRVAGPNPGGSFTTRENQIALEASLAPGYDGSVGWEFVDDPSDGVDSPHVVVGQGPNTTGGIGHSPGGRDRWPTSHPGPMDKKAFRYLVRAYAAYGGNRVYSDPVILAQSVVDVIRQEYIDYGTPTNLTPSHDAFIHAKPPFVGVYQHAPNSETGLGDYCVTGGGSCTTLVSDRLSPFITWLQGVWKHQPLVITSILRNPVHHRTHMGDIQTNDSPHKYGTAIDYDVSGEDHSRTQKLHWTALRNTGIRYPQGGVCAETWYLGKWWAGHHVHFDRRYTAQNACPVSWKQPEDLSGQYSWSALGETVPDTLVDMLGSTDFAVRLAAASALSQMPRIALPRGYADVALAQLDIEIGRRRTGTRVDHEEYGAYLMELARLVHRSENPAAATSLARLGIDVSLGIRRFVARHSAQTIPALEDVWAGEEAMQADVVGTYGEMLRFQLDSGWVLTPDDAAAVDRAFIRAASSGVIGQWGLAFHADELGLAEYAPLLSYLASLPRSEEDPYGLVGSAASEGSARLQVLVANTDVATHVRVTMRLLSSICHGAIGQRLGQCTGLTNELRNVERSLATGNSPAARHTLEAYIGLLQRATVRQVFSAPEHRLLDAHASALIEKLH